MILIPRSITALLSIDSKLVFSEFVRVTDLLLKYEITKMSFVEVKAEKNP